VRKRNFPYVARKKEIKDNRRYDLAQENEFSEVIRLIGKFVDAAQASPTLPPRMML